MIKFDRTKHRDGRETISPSFEITFDDGDHRGEIYKGSYGCCDNPCCKCDVLSIRMRSSTTTRDEQRPEYSFDLMLAAKDLSKPDGHSTIERNFGRAFIRELSDDGWEHLKVGHLALKRHTTETLDIKLARPEFPDLKKEGTVVSYKDILPFAEPFDVDVPRTLVAFDSYCTRPGCDCNEVFLAFQPIGYSKADFDTFDMTSLRIDYKGRQIVGTLSASRDPALPRPQQMLAEVLDANSNFWTEVARRHSNLKSLYGKFLKDHPEQNVVEVPQTRSEVARVGRNDLCPCGSGKKFKKCCLGTASSHTTPDVGMSMR